MKPNILLRTNIMVCIVIVLGFIITSIISYQSNQGIFRKDVENVSALTSEGIYYQIESIFTKPVNVSLTMANDSLLKEFLTNEKSHLHDTKYIRILQDYLEAYRKQYNYDSVFLVSTQTNRYYHFNGLDRVLTPDNPENVWYYDFLKSNIEYSLNIDNDEALNNEITIFINCRIKDTDGKTLGVVGVGFRVDYLQELLKSYEEQFKVRACLIGEDGTLELSTQQTGYHKVNLFDACVYPDLKKKILENKKTSQAFWHSSASREDYIVSRFLPSLQWHLIVENDTSALSQQLKMQFYRNVVVVVVIISCVLLTITSVIRKYNMQIVRLTIAMEQKHRMIFQEATAELYENIYEIDLTHNCAASEQTVLYFESVGADPTGPYDWALKTIAQKQIKEEFRQNYLDTFSRENVLKSYREGITSLSYDCMISSDGGLTYYWMRITTRIFFWDEDDSVRMFVYCQNIDAEKRHERHLFEQMQRDPLTGLYNKVATQEHIRQRLADEPETMFAFFILDVDKFKQVNDTLGHSVGDSVLITFARKLKSHFRDDDVVGRIGGDEFVAFLPIPNRKTAEKKAKDLVAALRWEVTTEAGVCPVSTSIGIALVPGTGKTFEVLYRNADAAMYQTKKRGRNGFTICESACIVAFRDDTPAPAEAGGDDRGL